MSQEQIQNFLDDITKLRLSISFNDWYIVDVAGVLDNCEIKMYELDENGDSLIFLKNSLLFCSPELGVMRHYPRSLVHLFVKDTLHTIEKNSALEAELFSITPESEQLCWVYTTDTSENKAGVTDMQEVHKKIASWLEWLNA